MADIQVEMSKDVRKIKEKAFGPFSFREAACLGVGAGIGFIIFKIAGGAGLPTDVAGFIAVIPMIIAGIISKVQIYNMYLEEAIKVIYPLYNRPAERLYDTGFVDAYEDIMKEEGKKHPPKKKKKKKPNAPRLR